jgi:hypothetical protein
LREKLANCMRNPPQNPRIMYQSCLNEPIACHVLVGKLAKILPILVQGGRPPCSDSVWLADGLEVHILGLWYKSVNFGAEID